MRNNATCAGLLFIAQCCSMAQTTTSLGTGSSTVPETAAVRSSQPAYIPLTESDRLRQYFRTTFSPLGVAMSAAGAGISQWENTPSEWGQGAEGYGRRFANSYGQHLLRQTMMFGASSVLHEDNRYIRSGQSGFGPRLKYAIASTFLARRDDGARRFSFSRIGSTAGAAFISRTWQPRSTSTPVDATTSFGIAIGAQAGLNVAREFLLHRR